MTDNLRSKFRRGQTVYIIMKIEGAPKIFEQSVVGVTSDHLKLSGGNPKPWYSDYRLEPWIDRDGIHKQIAHDYVHLDIGSAKKQLIVELKEMQLELRQRELLVIKASIDVSADE